MILIANSHWLIALQGINPSLHNNSITWGDIFPFAILNFWNNRNKNNENNINISFSIFHVLRHVVEYNLLTARGSNLNRAILVSIVWNRPPQGWYKLNIGGAFKENICCSDAWGVIRNSNADWIVGFPKCIHTNSSTHAELLALQQGIQLALQLDI